MYHVKQIDTYESYYEHLCTIENDKDVLDTDIKGNSCSARLKRLWYELFLLSYSEKRSRYFYTSFHTMKNARAAHYRNYSCSIHPFSKFRSFWDCLILHVMLLNKVMFNINSSIIHHPSIYCHYFALVLEAFIIGDLFITARTGYIVKDSRQIVLDPYRIIINYLSTNIFIHVASAIPLHAIMFVRYGKDANCSECKCNLFIAALKFISLISTIRLYELSKYWKRERKSFKTTSIFRFLRVFVLGMVIMLEIMTFADALSIIYIVQNNKLDTRSYVSMVLMYKYHSNNDIDNFIFFCLEFSRICKNFLLFGYGLQPNERPFDQVSAMAVFVMAYAFHIWSFLGCYILIVRDISSEEQLILSQDRTLNILRARQLPDIIHTKVTRYYQCNMTELAVIEAQNGLYMSLPDALKRDIKLSCYRRQLTRIPYFSEWPYDLINELVQLLKGEVYLGNDVVADAWCQSDGLIIVEAGLLAVYSVRMEETGHLIDGDYFGELSLVTDKEIRMSTVIAVTYCRILYLDKNHFRKVMRSYPELFFKMKQLFKDTYDNLSIDNEDLEQRDMLIPTSK